METDRFEQENHKILLVDDIPINLKILDGILENKGYDLAFASTGQEVISNIDHIKPDLILLDISMPDMSGFEVCRILKDSFETKDIPIIFLTAKSEPEDIVQGFEMGAVDYITKPFNAAELLSRVHTHLELRKLNNLIINYYDRQLQIEIAQRKKLELEKKQLLSEMEEKNKLIQTWSTIDPYTQLDTHDSIVQKLATAIASARCYNYQLTISLLNIDDFKQINAQYGCMVGGSILKEIVNIIRKEVGNICEIGRYNGDEFLLIFMQQHEHIVREKIEMIRQNVEALSRDKNFCHVTLSGGIVSFKEENVAALLQNVDSCLAKAKSNGKNRIAC